MRVITCSSTYVSTCAQVPLNTYIYQRACLAFVLQERFAIKVAVRHEGWQQGRASASRRKGRASAARHRAAAPAHDHPTWLRTSRSPRQVCPVHSYQGAWLVENSEVSAKGEQCRRQPRASRRACVEQCRRQPNSAGPCRRQSRSGGPCRRQPRSGLWPWKKRPHGSQLRAPRGGTNRHAQPGFA